jgi:Zn-dependent protease
MESRDHTWNATPAPYPAPADRSLPDGPIHPGSGRGFGWRKLLAPLGATALLLVKFGAKLKALLLLLPKIKLFSTSATMLVSIGAYSLIWGWKFAVGFVALLFVHEMGHYIQLRREGVKPSGMLFIPFLGAVVGARSLGGSALAEARVGLAGPILGSLGAAAVAVAGFAADSDLLKAMAFTGFFLNLFNLLPVVPLDGGRAMAAMAPWMWFVGLAAMITLVFVWPNPILILIALFGVLEVYRRWNNRRKGEEGNEDYYRVKPVHRLAVGAVYVGLIAALALGMDLTYVDRDFSDA